MQDILPLGSIVNLKRKEDVEGQTPKIMIIGRYLIDSNTGAVCDYMGLVYPFGFQGLEAIIFFDEPAIEEVIFEGYLNEEEIMYGNEIIQGLNKKRAELEGEQNEINNEKRN